MAPRTETKIIIGAMHILARDIQSQDQVANDAIREAAYRLDELNDKVADQDDQIRKLNEDVAELESKLKGHKSANAILESEIDQLRDLLNEIRTELYEHTEGDFFRDWLEKSNKFLGVEK